MIFRKKLFLAATWLLMALVHPEISPGQARQAKETTTRDLLYSPGSGERLEGSARISQYQKLIDDKNYELSTSVRVPSINGGEKTDREITEKSEKLGPNEYRVERTVRTPDANGRLSPFELLNEEHEMKGKSEEVKRSFYRPDINGKMVAQSVENETTTQVSPTEKQSTRALYRPDVEGKFTLAELEEGFDKKVSDSTSVRETSRRVKDTNGRMNLFGTTKETTVKINDRSFRKECTVQQADENGKLALTDRILETQTEAPDGTKKYERVLESRNINPQIRNVNGTGLILSQRVTAEDKKLADGTVESTIKVETLDPLNLSSGLRLTEIVVETSKPSGGGKVSVERVVKRRDVNGNYTVSQKISETVEQR